MLEGTVCCYCGIKLAFCIIYKIKLYTDEDKLYKTIEVAKNGKGKSKIYVNKENALLREKAETLDGYVVAFEMQDDIVKKIFEDNPEVL